MTTTILIACTAFFFGLLLGLIIAGLMAEARRNDNAEKGGKE